MQANDLLPFQKCTVTWVIKQLTDTRRSVKRFLVADEVGLGKTKVASGVIQGLAGNKGNAFVIYITSSLDICQQNSRKLCQRIDQIIHADRICLLYNQNFPKRGIRVLCLTPSTSFDLARGTGSMEERAYIARYLSKRFSISKQSLAERLKGTAKQENFEDEMHKSKANFQMPPERVCQEIDRAWENAGWIQKLRSAQTKPEDFGQIVSGLRTGMAEAILKSLSPDLIILDEVQKFQHLIACDEKGELTHRSTRVLLNTNVPTLLLSATPYRSFVSAGEHSHSNTHVEQLKKILLFLTGESRTSTGITELLRNYADNLRDLKPENIELLLKQKNAIEAKLIKYVSRAERINFEDSAQAPFQEKMMAGKTFELTADHISEFLKLKNTVNSRRSLLHLWRSGEAPLTYLLQAEYKILDRIRKKGFRRIRNDRQLYSSLGKSDKHCKLTYLKKDLLRDRELAKFLWLPPTKPYYLGEGAFSAENIESVKPKKGLIFSSWTFVPKMIAAELSAWNQKNSAHRVAIHPLKDSAINYIRFWHPSLFLTGIISHYELSRGEVVEFASLLGKVEKKIVASLTAAGWKIGKSGADAMEILAELDIKSNPEFLKHIRSQFPKLKNEFTRGKKNRSGALSKAEIRRLSAGTELRIASRKAVKELALISLTSPAVCLLRSLVALDVLPDRSGATIGIIGDFCARNWKAFFNREGVVRVIQNSYSARYSHAEKMQRYLKDGNFQSVMDEFIFHLQPGRDDLAYKEILHKLAVVFGPKGGQLQVHVGPQRKKRVRAEMITLFGKIDELTQSRESVREAFNSPFWPFVLATTSIGQEGLDFHLYCKDIYHWNLPANPVDFEQREGRINRYNSLWVRQLLVEFVKVTVPNSKGFYWRSLYEDAPKHAHRNDRFNLGMSPHWMFTPKEQPSDRGYVRHVLAIPGSEEQPRYQRLIKDLELYRLTLGQPNQSQFLEQLKSNEYLSDIDPRGITICLFPYDRKYIDEELFNRYRSREHWPSLLADARDLLGTMKSKPDYGELSKQVTRLEKIIFNSSSERARVAALKSLLYFVNPHDDVHDRTPELGWIDDIKKMKAG